MRAIHRGLSHLAGRRGVWLALLCAWLSVMPHAALAQVDPPAPAGTCTTDAQFQVPTQTPGQGLVSTIVTNIQNVLDGIMETMFVAISGDSGFVFTVRAVVTLYIAIYGILFTFGMVQITLFDFAMRMVKIGIIAFLLSPGAWLFFSDTVVKFFNEGTNDIIAHVTAIAVGGIAVPYNPGDPSSHPFAVLDAAVVKAVSAKMAVTLLATFFTGPYGFLYGGLILICLGSFVKALLTALWVFLMSLVLRTLLFGLAPIFLSCLLFQRTRHLFDGWLNQVVNACLQPILLFIFFAFFAKLIESSIDQIIEVPVCWTESAEALRGAPTNFNYWRFTTLNSSNDYEPNPTGWGFAGPQNAPFDWHIFPIDIVAVLIFFLLAELANRFNSVILMMARELAGASTDLSSMRGALSEWMTPGKGANSLIDNVRGPGIGPGAVPGMGTRGGAAGAAENISRLTGRR